MHVPFCFPIWSKADKLLISMLPEYKNEARGPDLGRARSCPWGQAWEGQVCGVGLTRMCSSGKAVRHESMIFFFFFH